MRMVLFNIYGLSRNKSVNLEGFVVKSIAPISDESEKFYTFS